MRFKEFVALQEKNNLSYNTDYDDYISAINLYEQYHKGILQEGILDKLSSNIKAKFDFIKELASSSSVKIEDLVVMFKNSEIYDLFKNFKWDLKHLQKIVKSGFDLYAGLHDIIFKWKKLNKVVKWTDDKVKELQEFLNKHPKLKHLAGIAIAGLLMYAFLSGMDRGHYEDFDLTTLIDALHGKVSLEDLFGGYKGLQFLSHLLIGGFAGSIVTYPISNVAKLGAALIYSLAKRYKLNKIEKSIKI